MPRWSVSIGHLSETQLAALGYRLIRETARFAIYEDPRGDDHIVDKARPFILVDDVNETVALGAATVYPIR